MRPPALHPIVIWFGRIGDMILLTALLDILHRRYGHPCQVIGTGSWMAELYAAHPDVARSIGLRRYTPGAFDGGWWRALRALRKSGNGPVYVCEYVPRRLARVERLLSLGGIDRTRCLFITCEASVNQTHQVDRMVAFGKLTPAAFQADDYPWPAPAPRGAPWLRVSAAAREECAAWLEARGWGERPLVLVQPGNQRTMRGRKLRVSSDDDKAWPIERWAELLQRIHAHMPQALIVLRGAAREGLLLEWISATAQLPAVLVAQTSLARLMALCARAHSMISVDTGPAHAAAALGLPLVVVHPQPHWLPRSPSGSPVVGVGGPPQFSRLGEISVEAVLAAWRALPVAGAALTPTTARATAP
jgi:heptosyltransferase-2/heptosyltransferase-3